MSDANVLGLIARDGRPWGADFGDVISQHGCGVIWWGQLSDMLVVADMLREQLAKQGYFEFYKISQNYARCKWKVIDFALKEDYAKKYEEWKLKDPAWLEKSIDDYSEGGKTARIVLLIKDFEEIQQSEQIYVNDFCTFNGKSPTVQNAVAYTHILTKLQKSNRLMIEDIKQLLEQKKNIILQGAPGTGKTFITAELALNVCGVDTSRMSREELMKEYSRLSEVGQIAFVTFHQTMDYDDFVEGLKPHMESGNVSYELEDGIFKKISQLADINDDSNFDECYDRFVNDIQEVDYYPVTSSGGATFHVSVNSNQNLTLYTGIDKKMNGVLTQDNIRLEYYGHGVKYWVGYKKGIVNLLKEKYGLRDVVSSDKKNYVLIIDEINRGNVSKIFGELITLLEADKRTGEANCIPVKLSYSKVPFSVPSNLYIIGTMNTTDRSVGSVDYAIRRRFAFFTLESSWEVAASSYKDEREKDEARRLFEAVGNYIKKTATDMDFEDLMVGHSYFMNNGTPLERRWEYEILPLLNEYFKDGILSKHPLADIRKKTDTKDERNLYMKRFIDQYQN